MLLAAAMPIKRALMSVNVVLLLMFWVVASAQDVPVIDLTTVHIQKLKREPTQGMLVGGVAGGNPSWPLQVRLISAREDRDVHPPALVYEFELKNTGKAAIDLPVDPSPRDVEPADAAIKRYQYVHANITFQFGKESAGLKAESLQLYGNPSATGTSRRLAPGSAVRIRAKSDLMGSSLETGGVPLTMNASLTLFRSVVKGNTLEERQIMGPVESSNSVEVVVR